MVKNYAPYKDEIIRLYKDHNVDEVVKIMELEHKFKASRRWYLTMFAEWKCQKTSNRKKIQTRKEKEKSSESVRAESGDDDQSHYSNEDYRSRTHKPSDDSPREPQFLLECPYVSCVAGPFALPHDYLDHKAEIHKFHRPLVRRLEGATTAVGACLQSFLNTSAERRHLNARDRGILLSKDHDYTVAEMIDCAQVVLDHEFEHCQMAGIVATLLSRQHDPYTATFVMDGLVSVVMKILGDGIYYLPDPISWIGRMSHICGFRKDDVRLPCVWDVVSFQVAKFEIHEDLRVLRTYAQTHMLETYVSTLEALSNHLKLRIPSVDQIFTMCHRLGIPLDVSYVRTLHQLNLKQVRVRP